MAAMKLHAWIGLGTFSAWAGCGEGADFTKVYAELEANIDKTCACKDAACVQLADGERGKIMAKLEDAKGDPEVAKKLADLSVKHGECVVKAMGAAGHK